MAARTVTMIPPTINPLTRQSVVAAKKRRTAGYTKRYNGLVQRYETVREKLKELQKKRTARQKKAEAITRFMDRLAERDEPLTTLTDGLWLDSIDLVTVHAEGTLTFRFQNGKEVAV